MFPERSEQNSEVNSLDGGETQEDVCLWNDQDIKADYSCSVKVNFSSVMNNFHSGVQYFTIIVFEYWT